MSGFKNIKQQEIPFILDGRTIFKGVTKNTTCFDVINKLPKLQVPLAVFERVDGVEKELTGKTKLLKVWRSYGSIREVEFVIRKSQKLTKAKKTKPKVLLASKEFEKASVKSKKGKELSKNTLKQISDLAFYVRYQKTKVQALNKEAGTSEQHRLMKRMTSNASVNSMDAFLAKADLNEMAKFLSFCDEVTAEKLGKGKARKQLAEYSVETQQAKDSETSDTQPKKQVIRKSLKSMKLGIKQKFASKKNVQRATSTVTISSTDTGYHSACSEGECHISSVDQSSKTSTMSLGVPTRHTFVFSETRDGPRHSTPVFAGRTQKRRAENFESTFTAENTLAADALDQLDELHGKTMLLKKFMADQTMPVLSQLSKNNAQVCKSPEVQGRRMDRYSMPEFCSQKDVCQFLWNNCYDSDSDSEGDISQPCESLDVAFTADEINDTVKSHPRTLRRESAISNLNRFSLLSRDIGLDTFDETNNAFDYSFDCSFPRMDETQSDDFSMDFSYDYDDSDSESFLGISREITTY